MLMKHLLRSELLDRSLRASLVRYIGGYRREKIDVTQDVKIKEFISSLSNEDRQRLYGKLQKALIEQRKLEKDLEKDNTWQKLWQTGAARIRKYIDRPSVSQLKRLFLFHSLPYVAFGFLDNSIMILAGGYIEAHIGSAIGFSTLASAGLGNTIADAISIGMAYYVERAFTKVVEVPTSITLGQFQLKQTRIVIQSARIIGITFGCLLGITPVLFIGK